MTAQIRQNRKVIPSGGSTDLPTAWIYRNSNQSIADITDTDVSFSGWGRSVGATHVSWAVGSPTAISIDEDGWYQFDVVVYFASNATGYRLAGVGTATASPGASTNAVNGDATILAFSWMAHYTTPNSESVYVHQNSGGALNVTRCDVQVTKLNGLGIEFP